MTDRAASSARPAFLAWLPGFLFETDSVPERYIAKAWLTVLGPSIVLSILVQLLAPEASDPDIRVGGLISILVLVIVGPILETLLMILPLLGLNRLFGPGLAVLGSAVLWGAVHSLATPAWGLIAWWPFLIMSIAMLTWREIGWGRALLVVFGIHALQNGFAAFILLMVE